MHFVRYKVHSHLRQARGHAQVADEGRNDTPDDRSRSTGRKCKVERRRHSSPAAVSKRRGVVCCVTHELSTAYAIPTAMSLCVPTKDNASLTQT